MSIVRYEEMRKIAFNMGFSNIPQAIKEIGKREFIQHYKKVEEKKLKKIKLKRKKRSRYPFKYMKPGETRIIDKEYSRELMSKYSSAARNWKNRDYPERHFSFKKTEEGIECTRVK